MINRHVLLGCAALAATMATASPGDARGSMHLTTYLTFTQPVGLPGVTLAPGTYVFELALPHTPANAVQVRSGDGRRLHYLGLTLPISRPYRMQGSVGVLLGESSEGAPPPVTIWYPPGDGDGRKFMY